MKKHLFTLLLCFAFSGCDKVETQRIKYGQMSISRAEMNNNVWEAWSNDLILIFNVWGDKVNELQFETGHPIIITHYYKFEPDNTIVHYLRYEFRTAKPGGPSVYFFKAVDNEAPYFEFDSDREVSSNLAPCGDDPDNGKCILYESSPSRFVLRARCKDRSRYEEELSKSQYAMREYSFELATDGELLKQLYNAPLGDKEAIEKMRREQY